MGSDEAKRASGKTSGLVFLLLLVLSVGGALGGLYWLGERKADSKSGPVDRPPELESPPNGDYFKAGRPRVDGPARTVFLDALPDFVIELDAWGRDQASDPSRIREDLKGSLSAVRAAAYKAEMPLQIMERLEALLEACLVAAVADEEALDEASDELLRRTLALNDALATAGLGFFVDRTLLSHRDGSRSVLLFTFEVLRAVLYRSGGHDVRTLRIRRLDILNWTYSSLGFTEPQRHDAVVLDNKVDEELLKLLPLLANNVLLDPFDLPLKDTYTPWYTEARKRAIAVVAAELGETGPDVIKLSDLVARRHEIYRDWNVRLESREMSIGYPKTLAVKWDYRRQMEGLATHSAMDSLDEIQDALKSHDMQQAFALARDHFAQSIERHETQHRLDIAGLYPMTMPAELFEYVGELPEDHWNKPGLASSAFAEMSAYLSELARDPMTPRTNLTLLARFLLNRQAWGMGESYAALVIFEGLAAELGMDHPPLVVGRSISRAAVAQLYMAFTDLDSDTLQDASMTLWARYFQTDLPVLELVAR